jgi:hypothetical protein
MRASTCLATRRAFDTWLARGAVGFALLAVAASTGEPLVAIPALLVALITLHGCPMCWIFGLIARGAHNLALSTRKDPP